MGRAQATWPSDDFYCYDLVLATFIDMEQGVWRPGSQHETELGTKVRIWGFVVFAIFVCLNHLDAREDTHLTYSGWFLFFTLCLYLLFNAYYFHAL